MDNIKQVILKDPVTGQHLSPKVYGALTYEPAPGGGSTPPYENSVTEDTLNAALENKADKEHTHTVSQITDMPDLTNAVPSGIICMWSGESTAIPSGWHLCDGTQNTPDLRDRFIVGAGSTYGVGTTGGEATHKLTTNEMPSHNHGFTGTSHNHSGSLNNATAASNGNHTHSVSSNGGGGYVAIGPVLMAGSEGSPDITILGTGSDMDPRKTASLTGGTNLYTIENDVNYARLDVQGSSSDSINIQSGGAHTHSVTGNVAVNSATAGGTISNTGGGQAHENRPPYYALCFIMKL